MKVIKIRKIREMFDYDLEWCCAELKELYNKWHYIENDNGKIKFFIHRGTGFPVYSKEISFCPFCNEKIETVNK